MHPSQIDDSEEKAHSDLIPNELKSRNSPTAETVAETEKIKFSDFFFSLIPILSTIFVNIVHEEIVEPKPYEPRARGETYIALHTFVFIHKYLLYCEHTKSTQGRRFSSLVLAESKIASCWYAVEHT